MDECSPKQKNSLPVSTCPELLLKIDQCSSTFVPLYLDIVQTSCHLHVLGKYAIYFLALGNDLLLQVR